MVEINIFLRKRQSRQSPFFDYAVKEILENSYLNDVN